MDEKTPVTAASPPAPKPAATPAPQQRGGVKETIESILIAFILAFIFRAFVVEAFVIPTGSMAPTLLGAHVRYTCEDCGWVYDVNVNSRQDVKTGTDVQVPTHVNPNLYDSICPNCSKQNTPKTGTVRYGDRILVLKYLEALADWGLVEHPRRWDVVVFKAPFDQPRFQQNYIKRLVALPNETVLILDGDVFTAPGNTTDINQFQIQRKHDEAQSALWRIVYDNDHLPLRADWKQPWTQRREQSAWNTDGRVFRFDGANTTASLVFDKDANRPTQPELDNFPLTDWLAYDRDPDRLEYQRVVRPFVSDLKWEGHYTRESGEGPFSVSLRKHADTFTAELTPNRIRLLRRTGDDAQPTIIGEVERTLPTGQSHHVELSNVDYRVTLRINREVVLQTTPEQYRPDPAKLLADFQQRNTTPSLPPVIEISAANQVSELAHIKLWRDIYYLNQVYPNSRQREVNWATPLQWPDGLIALGPDEYFVLGDNAAISLDARFWTDPISLTHEELTVDSGRVPKRFMLGKAFFVYWPAGYPLLTNGPALAPNFGEMRFIH